MLVACANVTAIATPPLNIIRVAKQQVENARYQLPLDIGNGLALTQLSYDSSKYTLVYRYHYYIPVVRPSNTIIRERKLGLIHLLKSDPNSQEMQLLTSGITFHYNYYTEDGEFLFAIKITPQDVK